MLVVAVVAGCVAGDPADDEARKAAIDTMYRGIKERSFPEVKDITVEALQADAEHYMLVDVRTDEERAVSMLPGAISKDVYENPDGEYKGFPVVVYCTIGGRSGQYAKTLSERDIEVYNLAGSILAWTHAGFPLVGPDGDETRKVHVNGPKWDLVAEGYESVW